MTFFSMFYQVEVRDSVAKEFTHSKGEVDDMMAGLHESRVRMAEEKFNLKEITKDLEKKTELVGIKD